MKKAFSSILIMSLLVSTVGCSSSSQSASSGGDTGQSSSESSTQADSQTADTSSSDEVLGLPPMTTDEITLTYASWENHELSMYLADQFMEKYPNITVEVLTLDLDGYMESLFNLAGAGNLPDVYWYLGNVDIPIRNGWLGDITYYFENDPESEEVLESLKVQGYFDGERKLAAPVKYLPYTVFLDKNLFARMNVDMPSADWTYSEMIELMKTMTIPEQGVFGYNSFTQLFTMAPIVNTDAWGEFGWDGEQYDMTGEWAEAINQHAEFIRTNVHAPLFGTEEAAAAFGDAELWAASTGKVAMQLDAFWTMELFAQPEFVDKGIEFVPYPVPRGDNATSTRKPAFVDFGAISAVTPYPREAYELLKFMNWSKEGWEHRLDAYATLEREDGQKLFTYTDCLPIVNDEQLWEDVKAFLPDIPEMDAFLAELKEPIPLGGASQPGFQTFLDEVYFGGEYGNIEEQIANGNINAHDVSQEMTNKLNEIREETLAELFILY